MMYSDNKKPTPRHGIELYEGRSVAACSPGAADTLYEIAEVELLNSKHLLDRARRCRGDREAARYVIAPEVSRIAGRLADEHEDSDFNVFAEPGSFPAMCIARALAPVLREPV